MKAVPFVRTLVLLALALPVMAQTPQQTDFITGATVGLTRSDLSYQPLASTETTFQWTQPGNVGNTGGGSTKPHGTFTWTPGETALFSISPASQYDTFYLYTRLPFPGYTPSYMSQSLNIKLSAADRSVSQAVEFEAQLSIGGVTHNMAWQACFKGCGAGAWRWFDYNNHVWNATSIPLPDFTSGAEIVATFALTSTTTEHLSLVINGTEYPVDIINPVTATGFGDKLTTAVQLDSDSAGDPYSAGLRGVEVKLTN